VAAAAAYTLLLAFFYLSRFRRIQPVGVKTVSFPRRRLLRYGGFTFFNDLGSSVLDEATDYLIVSAYLGTSAVGLYAFAVRVVRMFTRFLPTNVFQGLLHPVFFLRYAESKDPGDLNRMFNLLVKLNAFLCFPFCLGLYLLGDKLIIHLFDPKYIDALVPLWIIITFVTVDICMTSVGLVLKAVERVEILLQSKMFSVYNLAGDVLVAPVFGITGVAVVTGSAVVFKDLYCYYFARKHTGIAIEWRGLGAIFVNSLGMGLVVLLLRARVTDLSSLAGAVLAGALLYFLLSWGNKPFTRDESRTVNKLLPKPVFPF
jgi:O-antigen/teichoic acid export membrane protein